MSDDKSHVALTNCFYCGDGKDLLFHRRLGDVSHLHDKVVDMAPCPKCQDHMAKGIILIGVLPKRSEAGWDRPSKGSMPNPFRSGAFFVVTEDYIRRTVHGSMLGHVLKHRWTFVDHDVLARLGILESGEQKPFRRFSCDGCGYAWPDDEDHTVLPCPICKIDVTGSDVVRPHIESPEVPQ